MTENLTFRRARREDLAALVDLLHDDEMGRTREDNTRPIRREYVEAFDAILRDGNQFQLVVESAGQVVGTMQISIIPGLARLGARRGQLEGVRVHNAHRGTGVGQRMFEWAIQYCRERGCYLVQLTTDKTRTDAHRFYERLGFAASHEGYKLIL